jgi:hypothetical protein
MNHTKEPWEARRDPSYYGIVSEVYAGDKFILGTGGVHSPSELEANTKRIVACVNACADVEDKKLKLGYVKKLEKENAELRKVLLQNGYNAKLMEDV